MRILIFHGYLLSGTGSNVYNARLAAALTGLGHTVDLLSQDRHAEEQGFTDAVGDWDQGSLRVRTLRTPVRCTVYRPAIGAILPVYVQDRYEGIEARTFADCSEQEVEHYLAANVAAVQELVRRSRPQLALANHLVMGPVILRRALQGTGIPYAAKIHGSALEYTVKPNPERFLGLAREGVAGAAGVLVGSHHTAASLWRALDDPELARRTRLGPPGVDIERFRPLDQAEAARALQQMTEVLRARARARADAAPASASALAGVSASVGASAPARASAPASAFERDDDAAAAALERLNPGEDRLVAFVGKLIVSKGVDLLIAAWPLVLARVPAAKLLVTGFGAYRESLERLLQALARGDLASAREIAAAGRALETGEPADARPLRHLLAFFDDLCGSTGAADGDRLDTDEHEEHDLDGVDRYLAAARALPERVVFAGRLDHDELVSILPACEALVVPSTFPEAFGMVAVEGAACGAFPVSAAHSGLAEVSEALARALPAQAASWLSFAVDDRAVRTLAGNLTSWLGADPQLKQTARAGLVRTVRERWSWDGVARGVIAAAEGELDQLAKP